jgi:outer membrane murein-binding lipoprotein Lpp
MTKLDSEGHFLEKPSSLWMTIFAVVVSFAVALAVLQSGREVNAANIEDLRANYQTINEKLDKMNDKMTQTAVNQAEMKTDIEYIKKAVIIVQDK